MYLLAHEVFYVLSMSEENRAQRDTLYALLGFERFDSFEYPAEFEERRLSNPVAYSADHALTVETASASVADVVTVVQSAVPPEEVIELMSTEGPGAVLDVLDIVLLPIGHPNRSRSPRRQRNGRVRSALSCPRRAGVPRKRTASIRGHVERARRRS